jgi:hypothetical protein
VSYEFYKVLHLIGILMLFLSMGGAVIRSAIGAQNEKVEKFILMNHGISLLIIVIAGFGLLAKIGMVFAGWIIIKIVIWIVMGGLLVFIKRIPGKQSLFWFLILFLGATAAVMAIYKPF